ncbi:hypothetical protein [Cellvibrio sp. pealriver]|uniref:hypothetical protein n=1 Tax=Cellvibrio sp. pealriver TaxID=1622269 RepID=UPI00066FB510|nr:hypothetical protein [Cellvibrio sp. pealriver]
MEENIYAAPEATLTNTEADSVEQAFYVVSTAKFLTLFFFTFSLYGLYWHFKNWKQYKIAYDDHEPMPIMRAIFSIFFTHALFFAIDMRLKQLKTNFNWDPSTWATIAVISVFISPIIDHFAETNPAVGVIDFVSLVLMAIYGFALFKAQRAINISCNDPTGSSNSNFTFANCVWIFFGSIILTLALIGIFVPDDAL